VGLKGIGEADRAQALDALAIHRDDAVAGLHPRSGALYEGEGEQIRAPARDEGLQAEAGTTLGSWRSGSRSWHQRGLGGDAGAERGCGEELAGATSAAMSASCFWMTG
jgi:hypothetical protein